MPTQAVARSTVSPPDGVVSLRITGAFESGISTRHRLSDSIPDQEENPLLPLLRAKSLHWETDSRGAVPTYASGGGFLGALPLLIVRKRGTALLGLGGDELAELLDLTSTGATLTDVTIDFYDFGVATIEVALTTRWPIARAAELATELKARTRPRAEDNTATAAARIISTAFRQAQQELRATLSAEDEAIDPSSPDTAGPDPLWLHPVIVVPDDSWLSADDVPCCVHPLATHSGTLLPGIGWSAVTGRDPRANEAVVRCILLHWAAYAFALNLDRHLATTIRERRLGRPTTIVDAQSEADSIFEVYLDAEETLSRIETECVSHGGDELHVWDAVAEVQAYPGLRTALERKLRLIRELSERNLAQVTQLTDRRTSRALNVLASLAIAGTIFAAACLFISPGPTDPIWAWTLLALGLVLTGIYGWSLSGARERRGQTRHRTAPTRSRHRSHGGARA